MINNSFNKVPFFPRFLEIVRNANILQSLCFQSFECVASVHDDFVYELLMFLYDNFVSTLLRTVQCSQYIHFSQIMKKFIIFYIDFHVALYRGMQK